MVTGDPRRAVDVNNLGPVAQSQQRLGATLHDADPQHHVLGEVVIRAGRIEHDFERRRGQSQLAPQVVYGEMLVRQQPGLGAVHVG